MKKLRSSMLVGVLAVAVMIAGSITHPSQALAYMDCSRYQTYEQRAHKEASFLHRISVLQGARDNLWAQYLQTSDPFARFDMYLEIRKFDSEMSRMSEAIRYLYQVCAFGDRAVSGYEIRDTNVEVWHSTVV